MNPPSSPTVNLPDFSDRQYRVERELGRNREGGRVSYLATRLDEPAQKVAIKQFRFAQTDANWQGFKSYEREIQFLQELDHPRIPRYLDSFPTSDGFCMVQEYIAAPTLGQRRTFSRQEIKQIAISILEILEYLQGRLPPICHRDLKPENILIDDNLQAYLIDFGLARVEHQELAISSIVAGTPGFMPPEELFNRPLGKSSDLYSLGATLICQLTDTRSTDVSDLLDDNYQFKFDRLITDINPAFIDWLHKMVAIDRRYRWPDAKTARQKLVTIDLEANSSQPLILTPAKRFSKMWWGIGTAVAIPIAILCWKPTNHAPAQVEIPTATATTGNLAQDWFHRIKPRCNALEAATAINSSPPPSGWEGTGYAASCYALAGNIAAADLAIARLDPGVRPHAVNVVFNIGHPVADAGDDRSAGPMMELVLKYWPENYMAMYHAGMSAYALDRIPLAKQRLTDFLNTYRAQDGWTKNAQVVLGKIESGIGDRSYPKDP